MGLINFKTIDINKSSMYNISMRSLIVDNKYNNKKLNTFLLDNFNGLSMNTLYKALRKKDILVNNVRVKENVVLHTEDVVTLYITDSFLFKKINYDIIYEDENILVINKPTGIEVVNSNSSEDSLTTILQNKFRTFIQPCHRLDRNTFGLVLFAKNKTALEIILDKFKNREISKFYKCTVYGIPQINQATLEAYLFKDNKKSKVYIYNEPKKGAVKIITSYKILEIDRKNNTSILEVELHTGRTHQIRAHLAHIGYPIIGDGKYGKNEINKKFGKSMQDLCSYKLVFNFQTDAGVLNYLNKKEIVLK